MNSYTSIENEYVYPQITKQKPNKSLLLDQVSGSNSVDLHSSFANGKHGISSLKYSGLSIVSKNLSSVSPQFPNKLYFF